MAALIVISVASPTRSDASIPQTMADVWAYAGFPLVSATRVVDTCDSVATAPIIAPSDDQRQALLTEKLLGRAEGNITV